MSHSEERVQITTCLGFIQTHGYVCKGLIFKCLRDKSDTHTWFISCSLHDIKPISHVLRTYPPSDITHSARSTHISAQKFDRFRVKLGKLSKLEITKDLKLSFAALQGSSLIENGMQWKSWWHVSFFKLKNYPEGKPMRGCCFAVLSVILLVFFNFFLINYRF